MKRNFCASLCYMGAHGGEIQVNEKGIFYKAQKLTLPEQYKKIKMLYSDIKNIQCSAALFVFPAVIIECKNNIRYKFIVFHRKKFLKMVAGKFYYDKQIISCNDSL